MSDSLAKPKHGVGSFRRAMIWWLGVFVALPQAARLYLIQEAWPRESADPALLVKTVWIGMRADLIMAATGLLLAAMSAGLVWCVTASLHRGASRLDRAGRAATRTFQFMCWGLLAFLVLCLTVDMGYYHYNRQHLDFVFLEYLEDLWAERNNQDQQGVQAARQTQAEMGEGGKWGPRLLLFFIFLGGTYILWKAIFRRMLEPCMDRVGALPTLAANLLILIVMTLALLGFHPKGPTAIRAASISSGTYYTLAQNPILYAGEALRATLDSRLQERNRSKKGVGLDGDWVELPRLQGGRSDSGALSGALSEQEAMKVSQELLAQGGTFPFPEYPLVRRTEGPAQGLLDPSPNVLLLFVEALDRRYAGASVRLPEGLDKVGLGSVAAGAGEPAPIPLTPFLDRLKDDSLYFEHFFSNGAQTARGLLATLCSYYPRRGMSVMKTRYAQSFLCFPTVMGQKGYVTEMVISAHRDVDRLHLFMSRNGMHRVFDETDFPPSVIRMGTGSSLGVPDGPLFDFVRDRLRALTQERRPYLMTVKTLTTHHPFAVPGGDGVIEALKKDPDGYIAALRYFDREFGRFFSSARQEGLLDRTVVVILGDHGRHEHVGETALEKQMGHFLTPLYLWVPPALRAQIPIRPRTVSTVASQVDVAPTILSMIGLLPQDTPFLGRDLSCLLMRDCHHDNFAFLISPYGDELIGLADHEGILMYGLRTEALTWTDLALSREQASGLQADGRLAERARRLLSLYYSTNAVLDRNKVWPPQDLRARL